MDEHFYNISKKKKLGEWVMVPTTGSTDYDLGLFYLWTMVNELLETFYYSKRNISKLIPHEVYEIKKENQETAFIQRVFNVYMEITLSKLIDKHKKAWSLYQLTNAVRKHDWPEQKEIEAAIDIFATEIRHIQNARHERHAHTSWRNKPNVIYSVRVESYRNIIKKAVELLDRFVDGEIPYILHFGETKEYNLREILYSE